MDSAVLLTTIRERLEARRAELSAQAQTSNAQALARVEAHVASGCEGPGGCGRCNRTLLTLK